MTTLIRKAKKVQGTTTVKIISKKKIINVYTSYSNII